jgi:hypothetical protein
LLRKRAEFDAIVESIERGVAGIEAASRIRDSGSELATAHITLTDALTEYHAYLTAGIVPKHLTSAKMVTSERAGGWRNQPDSQYGETVRVPLCATRFLPGGGGQANMNCADCNRLTAEKTVRTEAYGNARAGAALARSAKQFSFVNVWCYTIPACGTMWIRAR